jgi:hypothetical protein
MSNIPHFQPLSTSANPAPAAVGRQRLRAVGPDEASPAPDFLPPGATWMPAPGHVLPAVAGGAPMVGYLVLVPAPAGEVPAPRQPAGEPAEPSITIDGERRAAIVDDHELDLTYLEFELLAHLIAHPHRVHTRDQLVTTVWGYGHVGDGRTVDVHIARLRRKLGAAHRDSIVTVRRVGYKYAPVVTARP